MTLARVDFSRDDAAQLCGRLAAMSRAGLPTGRVWQVLADGSGASAGVAGTVAGMMTVGGSARDGLRLAAGNSTGPGVEALHWLAITAQVSEASGAPSALVFDGVATGLLAQIAQLDVLETALAGPRATATVLASLPLAGMGLGLLMGINPVATLVGNPIGWVCSAAGGALLLAGRRWSARLIATAIATESGTESAIVGESKVESAAGLRGSPSKGLMPGPLVLELLAAVLRGGAPPPGALHAVGTALRAVGDVRGEGLLRAATRIGQPPGEVWQQPGEGLLAAVEEELLLAARSGLPPADLIDRAAGEERRRRAGAQLRAVRRLEVLLVLPAGLCLLPAFVLLGIVPLVLGLLAG